VPELLTTNPPGTRAPATPKRVFSYVVVHDNGFSPNPFHGLLTLACCKPEIRRTARVRDLIVGMSSRCEHVVYAMQVGAVIGFHQYWNDPHYHLRRPKWGSPLLVERNGDNIYEPAGDEFRQLRSWHSNPDGSENPSHKRRDLGDDYDNNVLVSSEFVYWGGSGPVLPADLGFLRVGRGLFSTEQIGAVETWFGSVSHGMLGAPSNWKAGDSSWRQS